MARACRPFVFAIIAFIVVAVGLMNSGEAEAPDAIFIFGDSTADVGTNTLLNTTKARADFPYNGIDYPYSKPTGRFSNGYNSADYIVRLLSSNYDRSPPPFLRLLQHMPTFKANVMKGANFASGGSGILYLTGKQTWGGVISLEEQIQQFSTVCSNLTEVLGAEKSQRLISTSLYLISVGSNDFFDFQRYNANSPPDTLLSNLYNAYYTHLTNLYKLGARKFGIISVPPIGCCPYERVLNGTGGCFDGMNFLAQKFYDLADKLLIQFSSEFKDVKYSLGNAYRMTINIIDNPLPYRFKEVHGACCGNGTLNGELPCTPNAKLCRNREDYLFWDWFHPTQAASELAALTLYGGAQEFVTPMNFSQLVLA